eukprot:2853501-Rhodomonas_salina.7
MVQTSATAPRSHSRRNSHSPAPAPASPCPCSPRSPAPSAAPALAPSPTAASSSSPSSSSSSASSVSRAGPPPASASAWPTRTLTVTSATICSNPSTSPTLTATRCTRWNAGGGAAAQIVPSSMSSTLRARMRPLSLHTPREPVCTRVCPPRPRQHASRPSTVPNRGTSALANQSTAHARRRERPTWFDGLPVGVGPAACDPEVVSVERLVQRIACPRRNTLCQLRTYGLTRLVWT